jgi:hypothetical protein
MTSTSNIRSTKSNVVKAPFATATKKKPSRKPTKKKAFWTLPRGCAAAILLVNLVLIGLSLSHLAEGVQLVTRCDGGPAWAMAIGIDLAFVVLKIALLLTPEELRAAVSKYASPAIQGTLALSAIMNALAFASHATGTLELPGLAPSLALPMLYPAMVLGVAIPTLIYLLTKTAAILAFHKA